MIMKSQKFGSYEHPTLLAIMDNGMTLIETGIPVTPNDKNLKSCRMLERIDNHLRSTWWCTDVTDDLWRRFPRANAPSCPLPAEKVA